MQNNNKNLIIRESLKLFYKNGYNKTSMRRIAEACNIAHPSIFNHFKNKAAIGDVMFFRFLHGLVHMTLVYSKDKAIDFKTSHEAMVFYWNAHYYYIQEDAGYFNFLWDYSTLQKSSDFKTVFYFRQIFNKFIYLNYKELPEKQLLYIRLIDCTILNISLSLNEDIITLEESVIEHFYQMYSIFKIDRGISDQEIRDFIHTLDIDKYLESNLLENVLLSDFGKTYLSTDTDILF